MTIRRLSTRTHRLDQSFLLAHLQGACTYKRIAGYFTSSLFEVADEMLELDSVVIIVWQRRFQFLPEVVRCA
ncbi:hypothetical protein [Desulfonatronum thioautotrophicum]|uniref:hypothetical protein n=1 Tax=Desulfonatronum thioautotrophicum TaxID=617001 RepID=UPI0005EAF3F1|nr:hypothetical protein [Desulfonatronum thioautotrophicum]